jgi:acetyl esterase
MPLDLKAKVMLGLWNALGTPPYRSMTVEEVRAGRLQRGAHLSIAIVPVAEVSDRTIPGPVEPIPIRIYRPEGSGPFPIVVFFHGGGFTICNIETHDPICRALSDASGSVVISVDYRLAPEHKFPAAPDDSLAATRWAAEHASTLDGDPARLFVAGDSAGGTLATVTALRIRDEGGPALLGQILLYPVVDSHNDPLPSYFDNAEGYGLTSDTMDWFTEQYLVTPADASHPHAFPLHHADLHGLPPALVLTAEYDPLRDEGELYAERLASAGVSTILSRYDGMIHGFIGYLGLFDQAMLAVEEVAEWIRAAQS